MTKLSALALFLIALPAAAENKSAATKPTDPVAATLKEIESTVGFVPAFMRAIPPTGTAQQRAVSALLTEIWGGPVIPAPELEALIASAGFSTIKFPPGPPAAPTLVVAQKS